MDSNARLPPISPATSNRPSYLLPSISNLVNVASEPLDPPRQAPEPPLPRLPSLSQQRHVKQHAELLPNSCSATHHNPPLAVAEIELPCAPPASPLEQFRPRVRANHGSREMGPRALPSPTQSWHLPPARHAYATTGTFAGPPAFHSSAPSSHPSERPAMWSHSSHSVRSARTSYPSHQNEPPMSAAAHPNADPTGGSGQNLPSFADTFGQSSAQSPARFPESRPDGPQITLARLREFESSRPTASYPADLRLRREPSMLQTNANSPVNTIVGTHRMSNYTPQPTIQFGLPLLQEYEFRPPEFSREPPAPAPAPAPAPRRTQLGRNQSYPGHQTAERVLPAGQPHPPPSPTSHLPVSHSTTTTTTVASSRAHGYPVGDWRSDYSRVPVMPHSMSNPLSSIPASFSRSLHTSPTLPSQPSPRPVPSHPHSYEAVISLDQEARGLNSVSPRRPSRGRGARGRQQGPRRVRSDLASDATRAASQSRKRPRRNAEKAFDPTAMARPPPMITITPAQPLQPQNGTGGSSGGTPGGLQATSSIPPRPRKLILQTGPEDLARVQALLTQDSRAAAVRNKHMKTIHEHCKIVRDFARYYEKYRPMGVRLPLQSEVDELAHRVLCIIELCQDLIFRTKRTQAERAGRDPDKEIASANAILSVLPTLRQALPATAVRGTSGDSPNPLKRDHNSMVSGTAVSLVLHIYSSPSLAPWHFLRPLPSPSLNCSSLSRANMASDTDSSWSSYASSQGPPVKSQQEIEMELIRNKRLAAQSGVKGKYTKRNKRAAPPQKCTSCGTKETPEWRRGPDGQRSLCNACGLHYAKLIKNQKGIWIGAGDPPPIDVLTLRQVTKIGVQPVFNDKGELVIPGFYRVPASQAQSVFIRAPSNTLPVAGAGGSGAGTDGGGDTESPAASDTPAIGSTQTCGPFAGEVPVDGLQVAVDEDEDLAMPAGKRRRWKAAPPEVIANATRATSSGASAQPALPPHSSPSAEPEQSACSDPESSQAPNANALVVDPGRPLQ